MKKVIEGYKIENAFREFPELETERLVLRAVEEEDYADMFEIYNDPEVLKYNGIDTLKSIKEAIVYTKRIREGYNVGYFLRWALVHKATGKMVGTIGIHHIESWNYKLEIGYIISKAHWRQGYAFEAWSLVIDYAFSRLGLRKLIAGAVVDNESSITVLKRLGFKIEGTFRKELFVDGEYRDVVRLGLLKEEFHKASCSFPSAE